jgi:hypothetical protein
MCRISIKNFLSLWHSIWNVKLYISLMLQKYIMVSCYVFSISKTLLYLNYIVCIHEDLSGQIIVIVVHYYYALLFARLKYLSWSVEVLWLCYLFTFLNKERRRRRKISLSSQEVYNNVLHDYAIVDVHNRLGRIRWCHGF